MRPRALLAAALLLTPLSAADRFSGVKPATNAEQLILQQLRAGVDADVSGLPESRRAVHAAFLRDLGRRTQDLISITGASFPDLASDRESSGLNLSGGLELHKCVFPKGVWLAEAHLGSLTLDGCRFGASAGFSPVHVVGSLSVVDCDFGAGQLFLRGDVGGDLTISSPIPAEIWLSRFTARNVEVVGPKSIGIESSAFVSLEISGRPSSTTGQPVPVGELRIADLTAKTVRLADMQTRFLTVAYSDIESGLFLLRIDADVLGLQSSKLGRLAFLRPGPAWPSKIDIEAAQIKSLYVGVDLGYVSAQQVHRNTLEFLGRANYSAPAFTQYEQSLADRGLTAEANETAFTMHEKWRASQYECGSVPRFRCLWNSAVRTPLVAFDLLQQYVFGLGRSVVAPLLWSAVFVIFGFYAFRSENFMDRRADKSPAPYSRWWYSLELFLPVVDLGVAKDWRPAGKPRWRSTYARIHQLAGWILIPVAIAALTGGLKK
jgi:hypothetical protein